MQLSPSEPCQLKWNCRNAPAGASPGKCYDCRLAESNPGAFNHYWPKDSSVKHPVLKNEAIERRLARLIEKRQARKNKDKTVKARLKNAARAEKVTEDRLVRATKNSGRSRQDGDHKAGDFFALDTKLQSTRKSPLVKLDELEKIRTQARKNLIPVGALVIRVQSGRGVVVMDEEDFGKVLKRLSETA